LFTVLAIQDRPWKNQSWNSPLLLLLLLPLVHTHSLSHTLLSNFHNTITLYIGSVPFLFIVQGTLPEPGFKSMRFALPINPRKRSQIIHPIAPILMKQRGNFFAFSLIFTVSKNSPAV